MKFLGSASQFAVPVPAGSGGTGLTSTASLFGNANAPVTYTSGISATVSSASSDATTVVYNNTLYVCTTAHTTTATFDVTKWQAVASLGTNFFLQFNTVTSAYTLQSSDNGLVIWVNSATPVTITLPTGFGLGFNCIVVQAGAGQVTISGAASVGLYSPRSYTKTAVQFSELSLLMIPAQGSDGASFLITGDGV